MPTGAAAGERKKSDASNNQTRETFRPPWVKDGPSPLPLPNVPWKAKSIRRDSNTSDGKSENLLANVQLRKTSVPSKELPENGTKDVTFVKPPLKPVPPKETSPKPKDKSKFDVKLNSVEERIKKEPPRVTTAESELDREIPALRNKLVREESVRRLSQNPPAPPLPPPPPPPPSVPPDFKRDPLNRKQLEKLEHLRSRPKNRPDWTSMLKEIEGKKRLNHVQCNDRSTPILPRCKSQSKTGEHFLYESEKAQQSTVHNELLKQIQNGVNLKSVKTNDRSKPQLEGLRKFRRQMTIEEQIQKSVSMASIAPVNLQEEIAVEADEMDDIDKVRDDLQSTKQMLAFELRNKEAQIRENKRIQAKLQALEEELAKERAKNIEGVSGGASDETVEKQIKSLQQDADQARKTKEEMEKKYHEASDQLENTKAELGDIKKEKIELEKRLQDVLQGKRGSMARQTSIANGEESEPEEESESSEESENDDEETRQRKVEKQIKQWSNKLKNYKNKEDNAKKERVALREIIKKHQTAMKEEKKKYKVLQKEVNKMAALMKDEDSEEDEEEEEKEESEEETEEEESSEESESGEEEDDDSASEKSMSEPEDAPPAKKKENYATRVKRHESVLAAIKKGNFMLKTNAERLQDDLNKQKEQTASLQEDLDSVLSELG